MHSRLILASLTFDWDSFGVRNSVIVLCASGQNAKAAKWLDCWPACMSLQSGCCMSIAGAMVQFHCCATRNDTHRRLRPNPFASAELAGLRQHWYFPGFYFPPTGPSTSCLCLQFCRLLSLLAPFNIGMCKAVSTRAPLPISPGSMTPASGIHNRGE